jgi:hypothetical protein
LDFLHHGWAEYEVGCTIATNRHAGAPQFIKIERGAAGWPEVEHPAALVKVEFNFEKMFVSALKGEILRSIMI